MCVAVTYQHRSSALARALSTCRSRTEMALPPPNSHASRTAKRLGTDTDLLLQRFDRWLGVDPDSNSKRSVWNLLDSARCLYTAPHSNPVVMTTLATLTLLSHTTSQTVHSLSIQSCQHGVVRSVHRARAATTPMCRILQH